MPSQPVRPHERLKASTAKAHDGYESEDVQKPNREGEQPGHKPRSGATFQVTDGPPNARPQQATGRSDAEHYEQMEPGHRTARRLATLVGACWTSQEQPTHERRHAPRVWSQLLS